MTVDFRALLNKNADEIERPKPIPVGTYHGSIVSNKFDESSNKKTPYVRFMVQLTSAGEDIDPADLEGVDISKKQLRKDYFLTDDALYRLKEFIESCKIQTSGRSLGECIPDLMNQPVIVEVTQRNSQDGKETFSEISDMRGEE